jgi:hypothetical protein
VTGSAIQRRDEALKNANVLFKKFELGEVNDDDFVAALVEFLKTQTACNQLWIDRYIETLEESAQAPLDPIARRDLAFAATFLVIDACAEGLRRKKGKRGKGPYKAEATRSLVLRLQHIYERAAGNKATISTANSLSLNTEKLSGPYPEFLRQADTVFKKIVKDSNCKWPQSFPGLAKEMRRKPRKWPPKPRK